MASIIILEDDPNQRLLYRMELEDAGHTVCTPENFEETMRLISDTPPDLMIMEPHQRYGQQIRSLSLIRSVAPDLPVIVYTTESLFGDDYRYFLTATYLTKSSDLSKLLRMVDEILDKNFLRKPFKSEWPF